MILTSGGFWRDGPFKTLGVFPSLKRSSVRCVGSTEPSFTRSRRRSLAAHAQTLVPGVITAMSDVITKLAPTVTLTLDRPRRQQR
jgi:hypothetical protein